MLNRSLARGLSTLLLGFLGGFGFFLLNLPLPWVLGSLAASALAAQATGFRPALPPQWRSFAMVAVGTMLGTGFTPDVVARSASWAPSLLIMLVLSLVCGAFAYAVFRRWARMDPLTALFAAMPGGLSVVIMLADEYRTESNRVVLCHTARLVVLLVSAPILIQWISGIDLAQANRAALEDGEAIDPLHHGLLLLVAVASWVAATRIRFPSGTLLLPLISSAFLHATGLLTVHVPLLFSILAQLIIGAGVGARFADYRFRRIIRDGGLAALVGCVLAAGSLLVAEMVGRVSGVAVAPLFLAYLPGGAPELGVVALALMIDPAMVAAHHVLRVVVIVAALPWMAARLAGKARQNR